MNQTPYNLERATTAGGFDHDPAIGQEIARRLHTVLSNRTQAGTEFDAPAVVDQTVEACMDLWQWDDMPEDQRGAPLSALTNSVGAMLIDLIKQTREARGVA